MRKGPQRHSNERINTAIRMWEGGLSLSAISRELKISKTTIKYWIDNAGKFKADEPVKNGEAPAAPKAQLHAALYGWGLLLRTYKKINGKLGQASFGDLVNLMSRLHERLPQLGGSAAQAQIPSRVLEVRQRYTLEVQEFLQKQNPKGAASVHEAELVKNQIDGLEAAGVEHKTPIETGAPPAEAAPEKTEANDAT